jgi:hypothetical protein
VADGAVIAEALAVGSRVSVLRADGDALGSPAATEVASSGDVLALGPDADAGDVEPGAHTTGRRIRISPATSTTAASTTAAMAQIGSRRWVCPALQGSGKDLSTTPSVSATLYLGHAAQSPSRQVLAWKSSSIVSAGRCVWQ